MKTVLVLAGLAIVGAGLYLWWRSQQSPPSNRLLNGIHELSNDSRLGADLIFRHGGIVTNRGLRS